MMDKSPTITELAKALSCAQAEIKPAAMNATNKFLNNKYADLGSVIEAVRPALAKNGLAFTQAVGCDGANVTVETMLMHSSGEYISQMLSLPIIEGKGNSLAQAMGGIITYLRRYSLSSALGVYTDEDTDGNGDKKPVARQEQPAKPAAVKPESVATPVADLKIAEALVKAGVCQHFAHAVQLITGYMPLEIQGDVEKAIAWGKLYRGWRDAGTAVQQAAENATAGASPQ